MSRARHHKRAHGGSTKPVWEAGGGTNAAKEAEEHEDGQHLKRGGRAHHGEGEKPKHGAHKRARGGHVGGHEPHHEVKSHSMHHKHGMKVPGRKRGGGVGANLTPLSTAANVKHVVKGEEPEGGMHSD